MNPKSTSAVTVLFIPSHSFFFFTIYLPPDVSGTSGASSRSQDQHQQLCCEPRLRENQEVFDHTWLLVQTPTGNIWRTSGGITLQLPAVHPAATLHEQQWTTDHMISSYHQSQHRSALYLCHVACFPSSAAVTHHCEQPLHTETPRHVTDSIFSRRWVTAFISDCSWGVGVGGCITFTDSLLVPPHHRWQV